MSEHFIYVNGINICYKIHGKEDSYPIICVHGFGSKKETWIAQVGDLSKIYRVIIFDLRGAGKSSRPEEPPYTMEMFADDIKGLMDFLKIKKAHIMGRSMGGMIAQNFVLRYPEKVNKLILINTSAGMRNKESIEMFKKAQIERYNLIQSNPEKVFWRDTRLGFHIKFRKQMEADPKKKFYGIWSVEDLIEYIKTNPSRPIDIKNQAHAIKSHSTFERLHQIKNETLLLTASHDKLVPKFFVEQIHQRIPNSIFKVIDKAGHESHYSRAPEVNKLILDFLES
ncbi:MAG: alpha/beta hydrolase [Promethearchaeota archaeon]|nr:MAG: alpha/beta hydrolase [Candidatus Lokiarchaeota archaeon]